MEKTPLIYVVDDDAAVRDALTLLLEQEGLQVEAFDSARAFLEACQSLRGVSCAIVDIHMPFMDGLQLQAELSRLGVRIPVIFLTGHGDIPMSVRAIKAGAVDFLTKPVSSGMLLHSVCAALEESRRRGHEAEVVYEASSHLAALTERERQVMALAVDGLANKEIARRLGISHRTVEIHRARIMQKTGAESLLDLARIAQQAASQPLPAANGG